MSAYCVFRNYAALEIFAFPNKVKVMFLKW